jgi:hypothetical protein
MFFALQFILVISEQAISHDYTGGRTPIGVFQKMAIQTGHRYRFGSIEVTGVFKHLFKLTQTPENKLPHDHGVEISSKYPKSRYANRDFPI